MNVHMMLIAPHHKSPMTQEQFSNAQHFIQTLNPANVWLLPGHIFYVTCTQIETDQHSQSTGLKTQMTHQKEEEQQSRVAAAAGFVFRPCLFTCSPLQASAHPNIEIFFPRSLADCSEVAGLVSMCSGSRLSRVWASPLWLRSFLHPSNRSKGQKQYNDCDLLANFLYCDIQVVKLT